MRQPTRLVAALAAVFLFCQTQLASAYDTALPHIWPLDPWKISNLKITVPTFGPINISLAIENPNTVSAGPEPQNNGYLPFAPSAANCSVTAERGAGPMKAECVETSQFSYGVFRVTGNNISPPNFTLAFNLEYNVTRWNSPMWKVYDAPATFEVGKNLTLGKYDNATRAWTYELRPENTPFEIPPAMTDCHGYCYIPPPTNDTR
ncbi:hypothetical protein F4821DRAFT_277124 [Hypoxylon rubiginosum]|uniref:Uncharacterized protein n=1 Tax=Hypoxylon rubiginosum TaxID=110542 RepID=A0ACC0D7H9_9PEZI|nr:hypothetical protein F4821DRAFT_277124 [Hypoxylon rubiginosum]